MLKKNNVGLCYRICMNYMLYQAKITYKSVVFNLFYAVTHFSTQCNVTTPF